MARKEGFLRALELDRAGSVAREAAACRDLTPRERGERLSALCRSTWAILRARPDFPEAVRWRDEPAPDLRPRWSQWMREHRDRRGAG